jgi:EAL domain-containing protein (putative c-di-GMP-specific phosphodiesterase class I)
VFAQHTRCAPVAPARRPLEPAPEPRSAWHRNRGRHDISQANGDEIAAVHKIIDEKLLRLALQPIVDMKSRKVFAYEALARSPLPIFAGPQELYAAAVRAGRVGELGRLHRTQATKACQDWPLFINVNPNEFDQGWLVRPDDPLFWHRQQVYLEITESAPLIYFEQCHSVLAEIRKKRVMLAVDDFGAGYSNLRYISDLTPEIVKFDRELVAGLREGSRLFRLVRSLVRLCKEMGTKVVAEGIETVAELAAVESARVDYGQGFLLARPNLPAPEAIWPAAL